MEHLTAMCRVLGLSLDEVVVNNQDEPKTAVQQQIVRGLHDLTAAQQELILATVEMLKAQK